VFNSVGKANKAEPADRKLVTKKLYAVVFVVLGVSANYLIGFTDSSIFEMYNDWDQGERYQNIMLTEVESDKLRKLVTEPNTSVKDYDPHAIKTNNHHE